MKIEGMYPKYLSHNEGKRDNYDGDDDEDSDDEVTRRVGNEGGVLK